jgi:prolycopene isomerase
MARSFPIVRGAPRSTYDVVIIGAGVGGLTCAALLARAGLRALIIEQHYMVGGYCSTFRRAGFTFDAATHFYPLLGNPNTITGRLIRDLGVEQDWIKLNPVDRFHAPDGWTFDVPADFDTYLSRLIAEFPHEADRIRGFFALVRGAYRAGLLQYFRGRRALSSLDVQNRSLLDVINDHIRDRRLKLLLMQDCGHWGSPPSRTSFVFDSMLRLAYFLGNFYPRNGSQAFVDALARRFAELGGDILIGTRAIKIAVHRETASGVEVETGPPRARRRYQIFANAVVSNADALQTCLQLVGPHHFDHEYVNALRRLRPTLPTFLTHIGVRDLSTSQLESAHGYHWRGWDPDEVANDGFIFKVFVPTLYEPAMAPPGCHVIILQKLVDLDFGSVTDWAAHKAAIESKCLLDLERMIPGVNSRILVKLSATAHTSWRYTLNERGAMLGWEMSPDQLGESRPPTAAPIRNLHFVGHWTRPGGGITPVLVSAIKVAEDVASLRIETPNWVPTPLETAFEECRP